MVARGFLIAILLSWSAACHGQDFRVYIGQLAHDSALIAWGKTTGGANTIGRSSDSWGRAGLRVGERRIDTEHNWAAVDGLRPDTEYDYEVLIEGRRIGAGRLRTWPEQADRLTFFVIGDYGNGSTGQKRVADAMWEEFQRREAAGDPVRFVITTGDNIYADFYFRGIGVRSGDDDRHWEDKFFRPYSDLLRRIPFLPTLGNHDGNASESRADLAAYLDNFFFPGNNPARWYRFSFGGLADFFAIDSTDNTKTGRTTGVEYEFGGEQHEWLKKELPASRAPWKIPYFHHAPFNAGPRHGPQYGTLSHFREVFREAGVAVVFTGHEHNLQFSERSPATGNMLFVVSGAGGELRSGSVPGSSMRRNSIAGWAPQRHFLVVEITGRSMAITPLSYSEVIVRDPSGRRMPMPVRVELH